MSGFPPTATRSDPAFTIANRSAVVPPIARLCQPLPLGEVTILPRPPTATNWVPVHTTSFNARPHVRKHGAFGLLNNDVHVAPSGEVTRPPLSATTTNCVPSHAMPCSPRVVPLVRGVTGIPVAGGIATAVAPSVPSPPPPHAMRARTATTREAAQADLIGLIGGPPVGVAAYAAPSALMGTEDDAVRTVPRGISLHRGSYARRSTQACAKKAGARPKRRRNADSPAGVTTSLRDSSTVTSQRSSL